MTTDNERQEQILILEGGKGSERAVSLRSAAQIGLILGELGYRVIMADPASADFSIERVVDGVDVIIPMIHGQGGEDGVFQQELEAMGRPFLGSSSAACSLTFDKARYRDFMVSHGICMATGEVVSRTSFERSKLRHVPYVLKPVDGGSSIDTIIVRDLANESSTGYFDELFMRHQQMLLEQLVVGQEITVGVLGNKPLPVILIVPPAESEFDYENKYNGTTQEIVNPPQLSAQIKERAQELALKIHHLAGCRHLSRTDMIVTPEGELYVLETNTLPGMTAQSLFPKAAAAAGYDMPALAQCFVDMAKGV